MSCNSVQYLSLRVQRSNGSIAQLGEHLPYKQRVIGSSPIVPTKRWPGSSAGQNASLSRQRSTVRARSGSPLLFASVAQLVEQRTENPRVVGSIPTGGTMDELVLTTHPFKCADVAHLVERHLAKVEVASSSLVIRSIFLSKFNMATQPSGKARVCKTLIPQFKSGCRLHDEVSLQNLSPKTLEKSRVFSIFKDNFLTFYRQNQNRHFLRPLGFELGN